MHYGPDWWVFMLCPQRLRHQQIVMAGKHEKVVVAVGSWLCLLLIITALWIKREW